MIVIDKIYFAKVNPNAIIPTKEYHNAGYDIYICSDEDVIEIQPHETELLPTGIASSCNSDYYFQLFERGSTGTKGIGQRCGVIDSSYRGEWFIPITNHNDKPLLIVKDCKNHIQKPCIVIYPMDKAIAQAVLLPVPKVEIQEISYDDLLNIKSERGTGKLGSSEK